MTELTAVTCPTCFEVFEVPTPPAPETPCEIDYDCEVCCRPMVIRFESFGDEIEGGAFSLDE
ncbi:MAG: CPXCG motif-containing cysteine-rich protein [Verrucomicrobiota bacterium]